MDTLKAEQDRGITIKSTGISLVFDSPTQDGKRVLVNLIDSPGHVDFSSEVTAALRITDGALLVVDCVEGASVQTETVTRQALAERIRPALHINKVDRAILELQLDAESLYKNLEKNIAAVNNILEAYDTGGPMGSVLVDPLKGNVSFGSGKQGWACTLPQFARALAKRNNSDPNVILKRLWGDHFYDPETKKFSSLPRSSTGKPLQRYVCQVVLDPLIRVFKASLIESAEELQPLWSMLDKIGINVPAEKKNLRGSALLTYVMRRWLPASDALVEMIVDHLPSPQAAQRYRVENLYTGPLDDECARAIRECDPAGPLVMYVSKMVPSADGKRFFSYGRVFAGTIRTGQRVRILGPDYTPGSTTDLFVNKAVQRTVLMMGRRNDAIDECPAGNTVALVGIDQYLLKSGTVTSSDTCHSITPMKFSVSPVVRVAVEPKSPADLPKLVEALKILTKPDPLIVVSTSSTGEHIIAGGGELHLEVVLGDLRTLLGDIPIIVSDPVVEFRETVSAKSSQAVLAKTQNNHNRLYLTAEPLGEELVQAVENKRINPRIQQDSNERAQILVKEFEWDANHAKKIWFFGPEPTFTNVFVDQTVGISYLEELKDGVTYVHHSIFY
jgi:elongation factor 2